MFIYKVENSQKQSNELIQIMERRSLLSKAEKVFEGVSRLPRGNTEYKVWGGRAHLRLSIDLRVFLVGYLSRISMTTGNTDVVMVQDQWA